MTEHDKDQGKWEGTIETKQSDLSKRLARLEALVIFIFVTLSGVGLNALGFIF